MSFLHGESLGSRDRPIREVSASQKLARGYDLGVGGSERRHVRRMDLGSGNRCSVERQVARGAGVVDDDGGVAKVRGGAAGRIDAHVAHGTDDHDLLDSLGVEQALQLGLPERVGVVLDEDRFALAGPHGRDDLDT